MFLIIYVKEVYIFNVYITPFAGLVILKLNILIFNRSWPIKIKI